MLTTRKQRGDTTEQTAFQYLTQHGLKLVTRNFHARFGEIDLIMLDQQMLVFVEVRFKNNDTHGSAAASVTYHKQNKIRKTAQYFLLTHPEYQRADCRFDIIAMDGGHIDWIKGAFY